MEHREQAEWLSFLHTNDIFFWDRSFFSLEHATLLSTLSVGWSVGRSVGRPAFVRSSGFVGGPALICRSPIINSSSVFVASLAIVGSSACVGSSAFVDKAVQPMWNEHFFFFFFHPHFFSCFFLSNFSLQILICLLPLVPTKLACCLQAMLACLETLSDPGYSIKLSYRSKWFLFFLSVRDPTGKQYFRRSYESLLYRLRVKKLSTESKASSKSMNTMTKQTW